MPHHLLPLLFATFLCASLCHSVYITTADELINLFSSATGDTLETDIELLDHLEFSHVLFTAPLGVSNDGKCMAFSGTFHGNGLSIRCLTMGMGWFKHAGLFCNLKNAIIENLVIDSSCSFIGDDAGALSLSVSGSLTIKHVTNNAAVGGKDRVGGFIGYVDGLGQQSVISFEDCVNNGNVSGSDNYAGGFVGVVSRNTDMTISNSVNNGIVIGNVIAGGFVGDINYLCSESITLGVLSSVNKGNVSSTEGMACGFVCVDPGCHANVKTTVKNSINKGSVNASTNGYGITNNITEARNVVSMGDVTGPSGSFTFWDASTEVDLFYGLNGKCFNCSDDATLFKHNTSTGFYEVFGTGKHVDDLLNDESKKQSYGMKWTSQLELTEQLLSVSTCGLFHQTFTSSMWESLSEVGNLSSYFNDEKLCVGDGDRQPRIAFKPTHLVTRNMSVVVGKCMNVTVGAPINKSETMIAGETLYHLASFFGFSLDDFIVVAKGSHQVLNQSSMIERDTVLKLCHNVNVSGERKESFLVEHGSQLSQVESLSPFWDEQYGIVDGNSETRIVYEPSHLVTTNMNIEIIKKHRVSVGKPFNTVVYVFPNTTIKEIGQEHQISFDGFIVMAKGSDQILNQSSMIGTDTVLKLCHNVSVNGVLNQTFTVEHGTTLDEISELNDFFNSSCVFYDNSTNTVLNRDTPVTSDIIAVIANVSQVDIVIKFDENENITEDDVKNAIKDMIDLPDDEHVWIEVVSQGDGSFIISIKQTGGEQTDIVGSLKDCSLFKQ